MSSSCSCASLPPNLKLSNPIPKLAPLPLDERQISSPPYRFVCVPRHFWDGNAACRYRSSSAVSRTLTCAAERAFSSIDVEGLLIHPADCVARNIARAVPLCLATFTIWSAEIKVPGTGQRRALEPTQSKMELEEIHTTAIRLWVP
jgi:hypothetical protein